MKLLIYFSVLTSLAFCQKQVPLVCDNATDNRAVLQSAMDSPNGRTIFIPHTSALPCLIGKGVGFYGITIPSNTHLICAKGVVLKQPNGTADFVRLLTTNLNSAHIEIEGCELDGNRSSITWPGQHNESLFIADSQHVHVHDTYIHDANGDGIGMYATVVTPADITIDHNHFYNNLRHEVTVVVGEHVNISSNYMQRAGILSGGCVHVEPDTSSQITRDISILNNECEGDGIAGDGITVTSQNTGSPLNTSVRISGNHIRKCFGIELYSTPHSEVSNNFITDPIDSPNPVIDVVTFDTTVTGNSINFTGGTQGSNRVGIQVNGSMLVPTPGMGRNRITENSVNGIHNVAYKLYQSSDNIVSGNSCDSPSGSFNACLYLQNGEAFSLRNMIANNLFANALFGIYMESGSSANFGLNVVRVVGTPFYREPGTSIDQDLMVVK